MKLDIWSINTAKISLSSVVNFPFKCFCKTSKDNHKINNGIFIKLN